MDISVKMNASGGLDILTSFIDSFLRTDTYYNIPSLFFYTKIIELNQLSTVFLS